MDADRNRMRKFISYLRASACICGSLLLIGCASNRRAITKPPYYGETKSMNDIVAAINDNNRKLPTLWSEIASMKAAWVDDKGKRHDETLDGGNLLYRSP